MSQPPVDPDQLLDAVIERLKRREAPPMPRSLLEPPPKRTGHKEMARPGRTSRSWARARPAQVSAIVFAVASVVFFLTVGRFGQRTFAFGDVQKAIGATKSMMYQLSVVNRDEPPVIFKVSCLGTDRSRAEISNGDVEIVNGREGAAMSLSRVNRTAVIRLMVPSPEFSEVMAHQITRFSTLPEKAGRRIGEREDNGSKVVDFLVEFDEHDYTVTVDEKTKLPIRMEFATDQLAGTGQHYRELFSDFQFDVLLDESLFAITPPPGYRVERNQLPDGAPPDDRSLVVSPEIGIGPVRFGMSEAQIVQLLGKPDQSTTGDSTMPPQTKTGLYSKPQTSVSTTLHYDSRGFQLDVSSLFRIGESTFPGYGLFGIRVFNEVDRLPTCRAFQGKTREGIRLGATPDDVLKAYGKPDAKTDLGSFGGLTYLKLGWIFEFRHGRLAGINLNSPRPAAELRAGNSFATEPPARK